MALERIAIKDTVLLEPQLIIPGLQDEILSLVRKKKIGTINDYGLIQDVSEVKILSSVILLQSKFIECEIDCVCLVFKPREGLEVTGSVEYITPAGVIVTYLENVMIHVRPDNLGDQAEIDEEAGEWVKIFYKDKEKTYRILDKMKTQLIAFDKKDGKYLCTGKHKWE
jgi:DNA-directed RNA polymerase subunit E'/Rpb7